MWKHAVEEPWHNISAKRSKVETAQIAYKLASEMDDELLIATHALYVEQTVEHLTKKSS